MIVGDKGAFWPEGDLKELSPGQGYYIYALNAYELCYDAAAANSAQHQVAGGVMAQMAMLSANGADEDSYGPFGSRDQIDDSDETGSPTTLRQMQVTVNLVSATEGDCVAVYRMDKNTICGLGRINANGCVTIVMTIKQGVGLHFKLWTAASGLDKPEILDCAAESDMTSPTQGEIANGLTLAFTKAATPITVTFNKNGGTGTMANQTVTNSVATKLDKCAFTKTGYSFKEWSGSDGKTYGDQQSVTLSADLALAAQWTGNVYRVTLDRQGGSGGTASVTATYGRSMPSITVPTRTGYSFGGYFTSTGGSGTRYYTATGASARYWYKTNDTTLYAMWVLPLPVYRFYSKSYKGHFFTIDESEKNSLISGNPNWKYEGAAYQAFKTQASGTVPLYRFYSKSYRGHFFTIDENEMRTIRDTNPNWKYEGVAYYVYPSSVSGAIPVYRFWSKAYRHHFYTTSEAEKNDLIAHNPNWKYETVAFYALPANSRATANGAARAVAAPAMRDSAGIAGAVGNAGVSGDADDAGCGAVAPWTLTFRWPCPGRVMTVPDVADLGEVTVETRDGMAAPLAIFAVAANADADDAEDAAELRLMLPEGVFTAQLWDGAGTLLEESEAEGVFDFSLAASGVWHSLNVLDANGKEVFAVWLMAEE